MPVRRIMTSRPGGRSSGPFTSFNLATHVGDDPVAVRANRERLAKATGLPVAGALAWMDQVHGTDVAIVTSAPAAPMPGTDGLVTSTPGIALAVLVADCVPVLLADPTAGVIGVVHAGRAGAQAGIVRRAVAVMCRAGAEPARMDVLLGPAICGQCYEVPAAMRDEVEAALPGSATTTGTGTAGLDLRAGVARQLAGLGVARTIVDPRCTAEDRQLFSFRRDGVTGRQAGVAWLDGNGTPG